jgi:2-polyprenyl-3-methyl-5-hydroxy-6-metoxy-1,4-benzoquinol methylase
MKIFNHETCSFTGEKIETAAVLGPFRQNNDRDRALLEQEGITVIDPSLQAPGFDFQESLADYDLLVTHFGISAFEALYARVPVLIFNPGPYHEHLTRYAGLPSAKAGKRHFRREIVAVYKAISGQSKAAACRWGLDGDGTGQTLAELLLNAVPRVYHSCPLCGAPAGRITGRFPDKSYRLCSCGTFFMARLGSTQAVYNRDYFFSEYKKQYGKTYLEDFPQLQKAAERRLSLITALHNARICDHGVTNHGVVKKNDANLSRLLDIGCAYGPFLAAARDNGFETVGLDPAPDAAAYVREKLGITALQGGFPESAGELERLCPERFDVITLWYVLEHFEEPDRALAAINGLLKMGGVLAFSTPSAAGISRRKSLRAFLERSPADHQTIWNPFRSAAILKRYGFTLKKRVITGHHPERFPGLSGLSKIRLFYYLILTISRIFGMGDTFEIYAVKTALFIDARSGISGGNHA